MARATERVKRWIVEALGGSLLGQTYSADPELVNTRPLTGQKDGKLRRDLTPLSHRDMLKVCVWLYVSNPMARWIIDSRVALVVGREIGYTIEINAEQAGISDDEAKEMTEAIRQVMDRFWEHPTHDIRHRASRYASTYLVTGHLILPVTAANEVDGVPQLDLIDAEQLKEVSGLNGSAMVPDVVAITDDTLEGRKYSAIRPDFDGLYPAAEKAGLDNDPVLYFRHSTLLNSLRGVSDLMDIADWLDGQDQFLFVALDGAKLRNNLVYDLTVNGVQEPEVKKQVDMLAGILAAGPGGVYGHNDQVKLEATSPKLEASDKSEIARLYRTFILGAKGIPESWYSEGGNANRATAGEQTDVAYKQLATLQEELKSIFRTILHYGYDQAQAKQHGKLPARSEAWLTLEPAMPAIAERDMSRASAMLAQVTAALSQAIADGLISERTARRVLLAAIAKLGEQIDLDAEEAQIESEREAKEERDAERQNNAARDALDKGLKDEKDPEVVDDAGAIPEKKLKPGEVAA